MNSGVDFDDINHTLESAEVLDIPGGTAVGRRTACDFRTGCLTVLTVAS
jgi:hypothetical protein